MTMVGRASVLLVAVFALGLVACGGDDGGSSGGGSGSGANPVVAGAPVIEVEGSSFEFDPSEFDVAAGDFTVALTSTDQRHDFLIEGVDGVIDAGAGDTVEGGFTIGEAGQYTYYCSIPGHREGGMEGTLTVT